MRIGILGSGIVGQTLGLKLVQLGHAVMLGTRAPSHLDEPKGRGPSARTLRAWLAETGAGASVGTFRDAAAHGELIINALSGAASLEVLQAVGAAHLNGKTLIDIANPIDVRSGFPLTLFVKDTDSLGELLQRGFPDLRAVKTLNTMSAALMVNPKLVAMATTRCSYAAMMGTRKRRSRACSVRWAGPTSSTSVTSQRHEGRKCCWRLDMRPCVRRAQWKRPSKSCADVHEPQRDPTRRPLSR